MRLALLSLCILSLALLLIAGPAPATAGSLPPGSLNWQPLAAPTPQPGQNTGGRQQPPPTGPGNSGFLTGPNAGDPLDIALAYVRGNAASLNLAAADLADVEVTDRYTTSHSGVTHIYLRQRVHDLAIANATMNINISADGRVLNVHHGFIAGAGASASAAGPALSPVEAVERAARRLGLAATASLAPHQAPAPSSPDRAVVLAGNGISREDIPIHLAYYAPDGRAPRLAWEMIIYPPDGQHWWQMWVDAATGKVLEQVDWASPDSYEVYPVPYESPDDGPRQVVSNPAAANPATSPFGWHDTNGEPGAEFAITRGNNVHAYADLANKNASAGDEPSGGDGLIFSAPLDLALQPATYVTASVINLFYWNNILHDIHYQYGFNEAAGNFQQNNYGRGGLSNDAVQAEAQDGSGINNANFATPPDGSKPRMQMFLFKGKPAPIFVTVNSPATIAGDYPAGRASAMGPQVFDIIAGVKLADNGAGVTIGCEAFTAGFFNGQIALIDRGICTFDAKAIYAQNAGAVGVIIVNNLLNQPAPGIGGDNPLVNIPVVSLSLEDGNTLKGQLAGPGVNVTLSAQASPPDRDSSLDSSIIIHEYGHGISNRLTGGPATSSCLGASESRGMGEGWSDFWALALTARPGDTGPQWRGIGNYVVFQLPTGPGIRRFPYSTDMAANPLTYADMPYTLASVHNIGEIWNSMLWDVYWKLIERNGFDPDLYNGSGGNNRMLQLVLDGLKLQPCRPSFVQARNAILLANLINSDGADQCTIWEGFARRGLGYSADAGHPDSIMDGTAAFDLPLFCQDTLNLTITSDLHVVQAGGLLTYTLTARNLLSTPASGVVLTASVPAGATYLAGGSESGGIVTWNIDDMAPETKITRTFRVRANPTLNLKAVLLAETGENGPGQWVVSRTEGSLDWSLNDWRPMAGEYAWYAAAPEGVTDQRLTLANPVLLPPGQILSFWHGFETEADYDGGVVEISTDGGNTWADLEPYIVRNGYNSIIDPATNSPIKGRPAFSGNSDGYVLTVVDLSSFAGQAVLIRFRLVTDEYAGEDGWYVDNTYIASQVQPVLRSTAGIAATGLNLAQAGSINPVINAPWLSYSPGGLSAILQAGQQLTYTLTLSNTGGESLSYSLASDAPWAAIPVAGGALPPFSHTTVAVIFNSSGLTQTGSYTGLLRFTGNMINTPVQPLPLRLQLAGPDARIYYLPVITKQAQ